MCDEYTNCTENCNQCLKEAMREEQKQSELLERVRADQQEYIDNIAKLSPAEIIGNAYEIFWRGELVVMLECTAFDYETLETLCKVPHLLDVLYDEWLGFDDGISEMLVDIIHRFAKEAKQ
jgi:hypothetical protein